MAVTERGRSDGSEDMSRAAAALALRLPNNLAPLAELAYNYRWSWVPGGASLFASIDPERWERSGNNPVRMLQETDPSRLLRLSQDRATVQAVAENAAAFEAYRDHALDPGLSARRPTAFLCAEFGVHASLPFYAGGLGVLAGDLLKEASDEAVPYAGVGLFYTEGSFHQRLDISGMQHEYWLPTDSDRLPAALVTGRHGNPLTVEIPLRGHPVSAQIWRVDVGRVPLYLLDTNRPENSPVDRWITARLYVGDHRLRLAQYAILGIGGIRALRAMGIDFGTVHLNEGHATFALLELVRTGLAEGMTFDAAVAITRGRTMFTTHTPVAAGNDTFSVGEIQEVVPDIAATLGLDQEGLHRIGRIHPDASSEPLGLTPLALRLSGSANGVSRLHGSIARHMWSGMWPGRAPDAVPIGHVTNGVHLPTWIGAPMQALLDRYVGGWRTAPEQSSVWLEIDQIPDEELWKARCAQRACLTAVVRERSVRERLGRGEPVTYAESADQSWADGDLTLGFARRIATYKRLYLITSHPDRATRLLGGSPGLQIVIAGRAHPQDDAAKRTVQDLFRANDLPNIGSRAVVLEDYDLRLAAQIVQGCDVWLNLPRRGQEASGTSGMKSAANGGLQLSVLDGWWDEAYDGQNGWAVSSDSAVDPEAQDAQDAAAVFDLLELEVLPLFTERDERGIPVDWLRRVRASLRTVLPRYSARRMLHDYIARAAAHADTTTS